MKKIGIMTFNLSDNNYGQLLQCYALQKYLKDAGYDVFEIMYDRENDYILDSFFNRLCNLFNIKNLLNSFRIRYYNLIIAFEKKKYPRRFDNFRNTYLNQTEIYRSFNELKNNPPKADVYITGSDQVWNFNTPPVKMVRNLIHAFFLDFGDSSIRKVSYAAGWGAKTIKEEFRNEVSPLLKKFSYISVREKSGIDICNYCGIFWAEWVQDPTLLLSANTYRELYSKVLIDIPVKKYILLYYLGGVSDFKLDKLYDWAKKQNLDIVYISGNTQVDKYKKCYASIEEWLCLIDKAEYVITNSFHGSVFSIIFNKRFVSIPARKQEQNERLSSLFEMCCIDERFLYDYDFSNVDKPYTAVIPEPIDITKIIGDV